MLADPTVPIDVGGAVKALVVVAALLVVIAIILRFWVRRMSLPCQFCRNVRINPFRELPRDVQASILAYFRDYEGREPDREGIFVCRDCKTVFDDYSGEKRSREADVFGSRHFCKVCGVIMTGCDVHNDNIVCTRCQTPYTWLVHEQSGFRFLSPPPHTQVVAKPMDWGHG